MFIIYRNSKPGKELTRKVSNRFFAQELVDLMNCKPVDGTVYTFEEEN